MGRRTSGPTTRIVLAPRLLLSSVFRTLLTVLPVRVSSLRPGGVEGNSCWAFDLRCVCRIKTRRLGARISASGNVSPGAQGVSACARIPGQNPSPGLTDWQGSGSSNYLVVARTRQRERWVANVWPHDPHPGRASSSLVLGRSNAPDGAACPSSRTTSQWGRRVIPVGRSTCAAAAGSKPVFSGPADLRVMQCLCRVLRESRPALRMPGPKPVAWSHGSGGLRPFE